MKKIFAAVAATVLLLLAGCSSDADVASKNLSTEADQFRVERRIVTTNLITGQFLFVVTGKCSLGNADTPNSHTITCKVGDNAFQKHFIEAPDGANLVITTEQIGDTFSDPYHYEWVFKPETVVPTVVR
jgi:hypothetical protein